jgi:hypothetical protein
MVQKLEQKAGQEGDPLMNALNGEGLNRGLFIYVFILSEPRFLLVLFNSVQQDVQINLPLNVSTSFIKVHLQNSK